MLASQGWVFLCLWSGDSQIFSTDERFFCDYPASQVVCNAL
jgi:hypothetical protein